MALHYIPTSSRVPGRLRDNIEILDEALYQVSLTAGAPGPQGEQGATGAQGIQGIPGNDGGQGPQGIPGNNGADGNDGAQGGQGIQGVPGNDGAPGVDGDDGAQGPAGPAPSGNGIITVTNGVLDTPLAFPGGTSTFLRADRSFAAPPGGGITTLKKTADQIINGTAFQNITDLTFPVSANTDYAFDFYITFRSTTATGFRFSVNGPAGVVDFFMTYQTIANSETVGVATWLQKHSVTFNAMTVTAASIAAGVDLHCRITGRFKCGGSGGTFAAIVASESANNDLVVQRGSWGTYF